MTATTIWLAILYENRIAYKNIIMLTQPTAEQLSIRLFLRVGEAAKTCVDYNKILSRFGIHFIAII